MLSGLWYSSDTKQLLAQFKNTSAYAIYQGVTEATYAALVAEEAKLENSSVGGVFRKLVSTVTPKDMWRYVLSDDISFTSDGNVILKGRVVAGDSTV